ncbi:MAG TPA: hypothetical protein VFD03_11350, partial [Clostridia bacterium]|nr:hypothetical protein [Clostridia bacterium]
FRLLCESVQQLVVFVPLVFFQEQALFDYCLFFSQLMPLDVKRVVRALSIDTLLTFNDATLSRAAKLSL